MVAFGHTAVGALVGIGVYHYLGNSNPGAGLIMTGTLGVASHYMADFIPHGHFFSHQDFKKKVGLDIVFDLFLSIAFFSGLAFAQNGLGWRFWYIFFGIGGAQLPDVLDGLYYLGVIPHNGLFKIENDFHRSMHWHGIFKKGVLIDGLPLKRSDIWQVLVLIIALLVTVHN